MEFGALAAVLAALGGVLKLVLDHLRKMTDQHTAAIDAMQARQETFLGNHMSGNTRALNDLVTVTGELVDSVNTLHDDNLETAAVLRKFREEKPA
jgi:hypothetical protein